MKSLYFFSFSQICGRWKWGRDICETNPSHRVLSVCTQKSPVSWSTRWWCVQLPTVPCRKRESFCGIGQATQSQCPQQMEIVNHLTLYLENLNPGKGCQKLEWTSVQLGENTIWRQRFIGVAIQSLLDLDSLHLSHISKANYFAS